MSLSAALAIDVLPFASAALPPAAASDRTPASPLAAGRGGEAAADLRLAQLLCARVCHDLIGAAGAIETGVDLLAEDGADRDDICDLIGLSGRQLNRRLSFYRLAFGMTGRAGDTRAVAEARRLAEGFLEGGRVALRWHVDGETAQVGRIGADETRLLLCAILVAAEGLRRGGVLSVRLERRDTGTMLAIDGEGRDATVADAAGVALASGQGLDAVTARTVPAYYLGLQLSALAADLGVEQGAGGFSLRIAIPGA